MIPRIPQLNTSKCVRCGLCVKDCIPGAIDPESMTIDPNKCMACGHCVAICPQNALGFTPSSGFLNPEKDHPGSFAKLVLERRTCRNYRPQPISREFLDQMADLVRFAPTGTNSQAVAITVLASPERVQEFSKAALRFFQNLACWINPLTLAFIWIFGGTKFVKKLKSYKQALVRASHNSEQDILTHKAPSLVLVHTPKGSATPSEDGVIWADTLVWYAQDRGMGTCYNGFVTRALGFSGKLRRLAGIPRGHRVWSSFTLGLPALTYQRPAPRMRCDLRVLD